ncbi:MAG: hypothetical protein M1546_16270 [Chloroflexi bacterium]|nr:hypothetical protein [Chloroflexota bacterium]
MIDFHLIMDHINAALPARPAPSSDPDLARWGEWVMEVGADAVCTPSRHGRLTGYEPYDYDRRSCSQVIADELAARATVTVTFVCQRNDALVIWCQADSKAAMLRLRLVGAVETSRTVAAVAELDGTSVLVIQEYRDGTYAFWHHVARRIARRELGLPLVEPEIEPDPVQLAPAVEWPDGRAWVVAESAVMAAAAEA